MGGDCHFNGTHTAADRDRAVPVYKRLQVVDGGYVAGGCRG